MAVLIVPGLPEACSVQTLFTKPILTAAELMALALDHGAQAERATCSKQQAELRRIADIYMVLATIDVPIALLELLDS